MKANFSLKFKLFDVFILSFVILSIISSIVATNIAFAKKSENTDRIVQIFCRNDVVKEINLEKIEGEKEYILHMEEHDNLRADMIILLSEDKGVKILLETMAGKGSELGKTTDELKYIIDNVDSNNLGVCLDTCHLHDSGVDLNNFDLYLKEFDEKIGINKIGCIHVNDSLNAISTHKDRHANFGFGNIGFDILINIIYNPIFENIPKILETPYVTKDDNSKERVYAPYKYEIEMIKSKEYNSNMINEIRNN